MQLTRCASLRTRLMRLRLPSSNDLFGFQMATSGEMGQHAIFCLFDFSRPFWHYKRIVAAILAAFFCPPPLCLSLPDRGQEYATLRFAVDICIYVCLVFMVCWRSGMCGRRQALSGTAATGRSVR